MNKPLQVYLDKDDLMRLEAFARARGWTKSQTIRAAIRALTRRTAEDPVLEPRIAHSLLRHKSVKQYNQPY